MTRMNSITFALSGNDTWLIGMALTLLGTVYGREADQALMEAFAPRESQTRLGQAPTPKQLHEIVNALILLHGFLTLPGYPIEAEDGTDVTERTRMETRVLLTRLLTYTGGDVTQLDLALARGQDEALRFQAAQP